MWVRLPPYQPITITDEGCMSTEDEMNEAIDNQLKDLWVDCPECVVVEDEDYCCTTCWANGRINVYEYMMSRKTSN